MTRHDGLEPLHHSYLLSLQKPPGSTPDKGQQHAHLYHDYPRKHLSDTSRPAVLAGREGRFARSAVLARSRCAAAAILAAWARAKPPKNYI